MEEKLISLDTAILAKEKAFNWKCRDWFDNKGNTQNLNAWTWNTNNGNRSDFTCTQPTQSLLQKWLREKYNINVLIEFDSISYGYRLIYVDKHYTTKVVFEMWDFYEDALEIGLQEALKLINN